MEIFEKIVGLYSWNWTVVHGSILTAEFGKATLSVREPKVVVEAESRAVRALARRRVTPVGEWSLSVGTEKWIVRSLYGEVSGINANKGAVELCEILKDMSGQILSSVEIDGRFLKLSFDLHGTLEIESNSEETVCDIYAHEEHVGSF